MKNNKGVTLIELIISVAIIGIMAVTISHFVGSSSNQFRSLFGNASNQIDSQDLADKLGTLIMGANRGISYQQNGSFVLNDAVAKGQTLSVDSSESQKAVSKGNNAVTEKQLILYNKDCIHRIWWDETDQKVCYSLQTGRIQEKADGTGTEFITDSDETKPAVLASNVTDFAVNLAQLETSGIVKFQFKLSDTRDKVTEENVTVRNSVKVNLSEDDVYAKEDLSADTEATTET
ncbi:MAG: prepilin-type N-terminal cleavage/methylation domain-containing protein, partial [Lachnospiraceae bacterium]|nr:prepilin-type N-terminal cleavage/methylation domain-containing protein [Lachnospiraceae bacterium]